jgi:hypothetical protein
MYHRLETAQFNTNLHEIRNISIYNIDADNQMCERTDNTTIYILSHIWLSTIRNRMQNIKIDADVDATLRMFQVELTYGEPKT